ncbi:hypothetical protein L226DRAFT_568374 [Lentinus tigrinus ALCF2SS1-7]|uniref:uncharacterized protein n=1 Tax=Lentinus tigrinus ALCF2SS1-7 TaxID=1328758 RepID=UPI0011661D28|nr:hypothetical protein L226DRAFT_568374 [Lentinus tigrinus ALCF2SS1-7]
MARTRRKNKTVSKLLKLPVELLCETAEHLKPKDLLMLARTCKTLRQCLMERNSAVIWRTARRNVKGLPEPPSYLSEPAYATFIFERRCYACYTSLHAQDIDRTFWRFAVRYCSKCRDKMIKPHSWEADILTDKVRDELQFFGQQLLTTEEGEWSWTRSGTGTTTEFLYHQPEVEEFGKTWKRLQKQDEAAKMEFARGRAAIVQELWFNTGKVRQISRGQKTENDVAAKAAKIKATGIIGLCAGGL